MKRINTVVTAAFLLLMFAIPDSVIAQERAPATPRQAPLPAPLFFRETWKEIPRETPNGELSVSSEYLANPSLALRTYGPGGKDVQLVYRYEPAGQPTFLWSGLTEGNWIVTLADKNNYVDLSGNAKIRWRTRQSGFHMLRPVLKLADGTILAADYIETQSADWRETEFYLSDLRWRALTADRGVEAPDGKLRDAVDLSKVDEIGFTDMMSGSGHGPGGSSRVDWIEVYGKPLKRAASK
jgi:hypothetical protein